MMRQLVLLTGFAAILTACSRAPEPKSAASIPAGYAVSAHGKPAMMGGFYLEPEHSVSRNAGDFAHDTNAQQFIAKMVRQHGFDQPQLQTILAQTRRLDYVLRLMEEQAPKPKSDATPTTPYLPRPNGAWLRYRNKFITPGNVQNGVAFWRQHQAALERAQRVYGVPPEIIVGIIGVETRWGKVMGNTRIIDALATLAFDYPRRASYFTQELEHFLLMARAQTLDPLSLKGSFAGAMGLGQFMPSSFRNYAVDFDGDGIIDLWDPVDAIGSVANYFKSQGWRSGDGVAVVAKGETTAPLDTGFNTKYSQSTLASVGLVPQSPLDHYTEVSLLRLDYGSNFQYWYGLPNFYIITRYNHSTHYAMAVWQLGNEVGKQVN